MIDSNYEIISVPASNVKINEELDGIIPKGWIETERFGKVLFKEAPSDREDIAESRTDWSEKIVSEINQLVGLPTALYELAVMIEDNQEVPGTISIDLSQPGDEEHFPLEELLQQSMSQYDYAFNYQVDNVIQALSDNNIRLPPNFSVPEGIKDGADMFVGVLMMDATVGNSDRHDRNLDIVRETNGQFYLSPVFDHGYSLGASEDNDLRSWIDPEHYNRYHNFSSFSDRGKEISGVEAFRQAAAIRPQAAKIWLNKLQQLDFGQIERVFAKIPSERLTQETKNFALELLKYNRKQLLNLDLVLSLNNEQQDRVEKIAPILIDYLKLNQNKTVENDNAVVKFDSKTKIITYQNKINPQEYLTAQYVENKWLDLGTNISQTKESYFTNIAAVNLAKLQSKKPKPTNNDFPGDKSRKRTR
ncbi:MAG: hypothetical protein RLZZ574_754 [Cyanobacteriota bacterium]